MSNDRNFSFQIGDHSYEGLTHGPSEGIVIALTLKSMLPEVLLEGILAFADASDEGMEDLDVQEILGKLDSERVGPALSSALARLAEKPKLIERLFAQTSRDGKALRTPTNFEAAYAGNYLELYQAAGQIIAANGFIPLPSMRTS